MSKNPVVILVNSMLNGGIFNEICDSEIISSLSFVNNSAKKLYEYM